MLRCLIIHLVLLSAAPLLGTAAPDKVFHLAGKDFSAAEAELFRIGNMDIKSSVQKNFSAAATIVLCERAGIKLSPELTYKKLQQSLLLMSENSRQEFDRMLQKNELDEKRWLEQQSKLLFNQINEAVLRWYAKTYNSTSPVTIQHIRSWYYRNLDLFRRIKVEPAGVWVFPANSAEKYRQALAALQQGVNGKTVQKQYAIKISEKELAASLRAPENQRSTPERGYHLIKNNQHIILLHKSAVSYIYLPLDENLQKAIGDALYDAVAKARLAETLKREFAGKEIKFY